jgi:hypothetical protein
MVRPLVASVLSYHCVWNESPSKRERTLAERWWLTVAPLDRRTNVNCSSRRPLRTHSTTTATHSTADTAAANVKRRRRIRGRIAEATGKKT